MSTEPFVVARPTLSRRHFLAAGAAAVGATAVLPVSGATAAGGSGASSAISVPPSTGRWLGPEVWGNRLADWMATERGWACVAAPGYRELCTASILTRSLTGGAATLQVRVRPDRAGGGFAGFLIGTGTDTEYRRTALVSTASGTGGGMLAVVGDDGAVSFRDHTDEANQLSYRRLGASGIKPRTRPAVGAVTTVMLTITPTDDAHVQLTLTAVGADGAEISRARRSGVARDEFGGGIALVSAADEADGPLWTLGGLTIDGAGVRVTTSQAMGAVLGTLFTVAGGVLKMSAQVAPFDRRSGDQVVLETQLPGGGWQQRAVAAVGAGYVGALRVDGWDATQSVPYRVRHSRVDGAWTGTVPAEPARTRPLRIATVSCSKSAHRLIDGASALDGGLEGGSPMPLYSAENVWFPYEQTFAAVAAQQPDLLVAMGDQYYETSPTREDQSADPELDFLYKYLQWLWAVRDVTRDRPTVVLTDDHDVFQGNLWGEGGIPAPNGDFRQGGYDKRASWVNLVQRVQCGHNPDPVDPAPIEQGINVYFTRFDYAGITFVILEDRKFKTSPNGVEGQPDAPFELLGPRQEAMLAQLARDKRARPGPTVVLTQTVYASVETKPDGQPTTDRDTAGFPKPARDRALSSIKAAGAVMLAGDSHLATMVRHLGLPRGDGPVQFTGPAVASGHQRWFEPAQSLPGARDTPYTGRMTDGLGNQFDVIAVANPKLSPQDGATRLDRGYELGQRDLKREGYGICVVDPTARTYRFEAWPGDVDPSQPGAAPYPGWPWTVGFDDA